VSASPVHFASNTNACGPSSIVHSSTADAAHPVESRTVSSAESPMKSLRPSVDQLGEHPARRENRSAVARADGYSPSFPS
jgi:hypothetical protein